MKKTPGPNPFLAESGGQRRVRSFVLREGRMTQAQRSALERLWNRFGITLVPADKKMQDHTLDIPALFNRRAPAILEIGFGNGDALVHMAAEEPDCDFVGIEVHRPGIGSALIKLENDDIQNVRVLCADAAEILKSATRPESLSGVRLYFPDPWPKKRHHKRRIVQPEFVARVCSALISGGVFHLATDWQPYAEHMLEVLDSAGKLVNMAGPGQFSERPAWRPETRFERRGLRLGHQVFDLLYQKSS